MAVTRPGGSIGGAGGKSIATTRLDVVDPHILIMMRDVMDSAETAVRLKPSAGSGGGGGGGAASSITGAANNDAGSGGTPSAVSNCINTNDGANGGAGSSGKEDSLLNTVEGGGGGGGAGGNGGAIVFITTTSTIGGTIQVNGGSAGTDGSRGQNSTSADLIPYDGNVGKIITVKV